MGLWRIFEGKRKRAIRRISAAKWFPDLDPGRIQGLDDVRLEAISTALDVVPDDKPSRDLFIAASPIFLEDQFDTTRLHKRPWADLATDLRSLVREQTGVRTSELTARISESLAEMNRLETDSKHFKDLSENMSRCRSGGDSDEAMVAEVKIRPDIRW